MATRIKVWEVNEGKIIPREDVNFADFRREDELEGWIVQSSDILGEKLLIIARQLPIQEVGRLDLLAMDSTGRLVIIELKRSMAPREAVAQALDYGSWLNNASEEEILASANQYLQNQPLEEAFDEYFDSPLPEWVCQNHRILLVAAGLDASAERIVNYLAQRHSIDINAVFFNYCKLSDDKEILVRSVLVPESVNPPKPPTRSDRWDTTEEALLAMANERKTVDLLKVCRQMQDVWEEVPKLTAGGSFRYWDPKAHRMMYGINVAGRLARPVGHYPALGELDIWVRTDTLAEVTGIAEEELKQRLSRDFSPFDAGRMDFVIRLKTTKQAETLVSVLKGIAAEPKKVTTAAA